MPTPPWLLRLGEGLLDLVFAPVCVACGGPIPAEDEVRMVCRLCWARARPLPEPTCARCGEPRLVASSDAACGGCAALLPGIRVVRSAYLMAPPASDMVHALKYRGWERAAEPMGRRMGAVPLPDDVRDEARLVVPVPVGAARLRERGFNQAEALARSFASGTGRMCAADALVRTRATQTQTALHPDERRANVAGAFAPGAGRAAEIRGEHVILLDDVWTTGATATACAETLLHSGARAVSVLTFARAIPALRETGEHAPR